MRRRLLPLDEEALGLSCMSTGICLQGERGRVKTQDTAAQIRHIWTAKAQLYCFLWVRLIISATSPTWTLKTLKPHSDLSMVMFFLITFKEEGRFSPGGRDNQPVWLPS